MAEGLPADDVAGCEYLPEPGRHVVADEYVDLQMCPDRGEHSDHYWSVLGHDHDEEDGFHVCHRYCEGRLIDGGGA